MIREEDGSSAAEVSISSPRCVMDAELLRILAIEDNPLDARVIQEILTRANRQPIELEHVQQLSAGLTQLASRRFDVVLVDLNLEDSSGVETVARVHACSPHVPIVVLTGVEADEVALQALKSGAEDFLYKSEMEPGLLLRSIQYAIERVAHRQADQQYREEEARYRQLLGAVTTYTYSVRLTNGSPVSTHHSLGCLSATGFGPEEYAADPYLWIRMVHPDDREMVQKYVAQVIVGKPVAPIEHRILHKDGSTRWIRDTIILNHDQTGALVGYDGLVEDISQRKRAELALRESEAHLLAAEGIQSRLWPTVPPSLPGFDVAGGVYPAEFAAGDYFDYLPMLDGSIGLVIGDVSGHGLGPAIVMALTYAHLRSLAQIYARGAEILARVNQFLVSETDHFVTLLFGRLAPAERSFISINAGHTPGYILDSEGRIKTRMESTALPLAVLPDTTFPASDPTILEPGDLILMLTDGVLEARSPEGAVFGIERTLEVVNAHRDLAAAEIVDAIHSAVRDFCLPGRPLDDVTTIVVKVGRQSVQPDR